jgi:plastocyanin/methionine-rich copper-binding protein CopC
MGSAAQASPEPTAAPVMARPRQHHTEHIEGLGEPIDAPHFVDSFPNHAQTLTQSPARVGINFDLPLTVESAITLERDGEMLETQAAEFDPRRIYMAVRVPPDQGDGLYVAKYRACFEDDSCSDGQIGFRVDAARVQSFEDLTGQADVTIQLKDITYQPHQIIITASTRVTWVNDDPFEHFVNSDPHPSHNAFPDFNSLDIPPTKTFSYTFEEPGEYAYHCSAHVPQNMYGTILVVPAAANVNTPTALPQAPTVTPTVTNAPTTERTAVPATTVPPEPTAAPTLLPTVPLPTETSAPPTTVPVTKVDEATLPPQRFAAHYVSSNPAHADLLTSLPSEIRLKFDFVLARNSNINVRKDGEKLTPGDLAFSENRLEMAVMLPDAGGGTYHVLYRACWPDKSCHDGEFAFVVR